MHNAHVRDKETVKKLKEKKEKTLPPRCQIDEVCTRVFIGGSSELHV